jgi:hypothetical protein
MLRPKCFDVLLVKFDLVSFVLVLLLKDLEVVFHIVNREFAEYVLTHEHAEREYI